MSEIDHQNNGGIRLLYTMGISVIYNHVSPCILIEKLGKVLKFCSPFLIKSAFHALFQSVYNAVCRFYHYNNLQKSHNGKLLHDIPLYLHQV